MQKSRLKPRECDGQKTGHLLSIISSITSINLMFLVEMIMNQISNLKNLPY